MDKRKRKGGKDTRITKKVVPLCVWTDILPVETWWEFAKYLLGEKHENAALLPQICEQWRSWYKSLEKQRFVEVIRTKHGLNMTTLFLCLDSCRRGFFQSFEITSEKYHEAKLTYIFCCVYGLEITPGYGFINTVLQNVLKTKTNGPLTDRNMVADVRRLAPTGEELHFVLEYQICVPDSENEEMCSDYKAIHVAPEDHIIWKILGEYSPGSDAPISEHLEPALENVEIRNKVLEMLRPYNKLYKYW